MGGRGSASVASKGQYMSKDRTMTSGGSGRHSADYKSSYDIEMADARNFTAAFAIESGADKASIGYQMHSYKAVTGKSLIGETRQEVTFLKGELRSANAMGKSYGMSQGSINGMKAGLKEKIKLRETAITKMEAARSEYERFQNEASSGNAKAKRRGGRWM